MMVPVDPAPGSTGDPGTPPGPAASPPRLGGARRALATIALTAGLLTVGGVSVVMVTVFGSVAWTPVRSDRWHDPHVPGRRGVEQLRIDEQLRSKLGHVGPEHSEAAPMWVPLLRVRDGSVAACRRRLEAHGLAGAARGAGAGR